LVIDCFPRNTALDSCPNLCSTLEEKNVLFPNVNDISLQFQATYIYSGQSLECLPGYKIFCEEGTKPKPHKIQQGFYFVEALGGGRTLHTYGTGIKFQTQYTFFY